MLRKVILLVFVTAVVGDYDYEEPLLYDYFPAEFLWGAATAAYQIEGGWNADGKSPSIWDEFSRIPGNIYDGSTGNVACDSYHKYKEDVQLLKDLGLTAYRFSIAWTRIIPSGIGELNQKGIQYYKNLINELKAVGIKPVVTLYHWDLPQVLQDQGGWLNSSVVDWFVSYARVCFQEYGQDVPLWITLNEPKITALKGYGYGVFAPGLAGGSGTNSYIAAHNQIRAHAAVYNLYKTEFAELTGKVGISLSVHWAEPRNSTNPDDIMASNTYMQFNLGWFAGPLLSGRGEYPAVMREKVDYKSSQQGFNVSRLPMFSKEDQALLKNATDFVGIHCYTSSIVYPTKEDISIISFDTDDDVADYQDESWLSSGSSWLKVTPWGVKKTLNWFKEEYGDHTPVYITELGVSDRLGNLDDLARIYYYKHGINQVLKAVKQDGVDVRGFFAWSLMDNFEWDRGFSEKFGLHFVDINSENRTRVAKASAKYYSGIVARNGFQDVGNPCESM